MASTKFINECKNGANSNRLGKISVETIKKVSRTKLELSNTLDKKISPRLKGYTKQNVYSGKNKNVNAENLTAGGSSPAEAFTNLTEYDGYKNVVEVSSTIAYMTLRANDVSSDLTEAITSGGIDITNMLLIKKTDVNTIVKLYLGDITGGNVYNELKHYKDEANGWAWYYTTHTIPANPSNKIIRIHISSPATNFATFYVAKIQTLIGSTPSDFEPYVGGKTTPRADMPQEIEVVAKNLFNVYKSSDGFIGNNNGDILAPNTASKEKTSDFIEVNQNEVIVCNLKATIPSDGYIWWGYIYYDINKIPITERQSIHNASNKLSLTVPLNAKYLRVSTRFYNDGILTIRKNTIITTKTTTKNLLKNSSFRENFDGWNHHGSVEITEKLGQKCMHIPCQLGTGAITSVRDIKDIVKHDNIYTLSAYVYAENIVAGTTNPTFAFYIDGKKIDGTWTNGLVTIKGSPNFKAYNYSNGFTKVSWTFKINTDLDLSSPFRLYVYTRDHTGDLYLYNLQLEPGDIDTEYQEYQESSITYNLGDNFLADKDYIENGVLNKNIRHLRLAVADMNNNDTFPGWRNVPYIGEDYPNQNTQLKTFCNYKCNIDVFSRGGLSLNSMGGGNGTVFINSRMLGITQTQWKEQYPDLVLDIYYEMPKTEQIPLETTGELKTYESGTIVTNDANIETEVEYSSWDTEITNGDNLTDVSIEDSCYVDGQIIGTTFEKKATSQLIAVPNDVDLIDKKIKVEIGVKYGDLSNEMVKMGNYTIERPKDEQTENFTQITAYDDFNSLDNPYVCNLDFSKDVTIADFYIDVCNQLELTPMKTTFLNSDIKVTANPFVNKETLRVVLQEIEKVSCTFSEIDYETNKIDLVWLSENEEPDYEFATSDYTTLEGGKITYGPVNCLVIKESQIEGENTVRQDDESIKTNGETQIAIQDSYFLFTQALREQAIDNIWNRVKGLTYVDCKLITSYGKPFLKVGKKIRVNVNDGRVFDTYVLKHTFKYDGAFESTIESPALTKQETKVKSKSISESIRLTEIRVDKAEGNIKATTKKVESIDTTVNNNYQDIINKFGDYTPTNKVIEIENSIEQLQTDTYTKTEINTKLTDGSVTKVMTTSGTFDENGMHYEKTGAPTKSTINESGVNVESSTTGEELLFAGYDKELEQTIVRTENLTVRNYLVIGSNSRIEDYEDENGNAGGGIFIL